MSTDNGSLIDKLFELFDTKTDAEIQEIEETATPRQKFYIKLWRKMRGK